MTHRLAYFLCATPRSGTTLLCDLLKVTGRAGDPQSYFRRQDIERRAHAYGLEAGDFLDRRDFHHAYLNAVLRDGAGGTGIFGLRMMWGTVGELVEWLSGFHLDATAATLFEEIFGPIVYVHISRRDKVAQAISLLKAEQSGLWHLAADGSERQRTNPGIPLSYDRDRITSIVAELERDEAAWDGFFVAHGIAPVQVEYADLAAHPRAKVRKILAALQVPPGAADGVRAQTSKMADCESHAWADRFRREQLAE